VLDVLHARLAERRIGIEKEVLKYGEAPTGIKEVFELCRGFERAYVEFVNESPVASKIREVFLGEKGLNGAIRKLPIEGVFELKNVKKICKEADGYQPHVMAPEAGIRRLGSDALDLVNAPVNAAVQQVYTLLVNAAREAAEKAGEFTESALMGAMPMHVPDFKTVIMPATVAALDEWKHEAVKMAMMLVEMERSYVTAGFFRHTMYHRSNRIKQQLAISMQAQQQEGQRGTNFGGAASGSAAAPEAKKPSKSFFPAFGAAKDEPLPPPKTQAGPATPPPPAKPQKDPAEREKKDDDDGSDNSDGPSTPNAEDRGGKGQLNADMNDPNAFLAANLDKYQSNDSAFSAMPGSWRWQKRFFIFSDAQRTLYYFKSAEDVQKGGTARGMIGISDCIVEDLDDKAQPIARPRTPGAETDKSQLMIRIRHRDPRGTAVKDHNAIVLRAESMDVKMQWLHRMQRASALGQMPAKKKGKAGDGLGYAPPPSTNMLDDLSWAQDAEPVINTHFGEGSAVFRADNARGSDGRLLPAPQMLLNPLRISEKARNATGIAAFEARYDALMEQFASDMTVYTRMVMDTIITTVPKAIVHSMIRRSEKSLLERLFNVIHHLSPQQMEALLKEEDSVVLGRKAARAALEDAKTCVFRVQQAMEKRNMAAANEKPPFLPVLANCFAYAGMPEQLSPEQRKYFDKLFADPHTPDAMKKWTVPPPIRALPPSMAASLAAKAQQTPASKGRPANAPPPGEEHKSTSGPGNPGRPPPIRREGNAGDGSLARPSASGASMSIRRKPPPPPPGGATPR